MPVVVTGADTPLGGLVVDRLAGRGLDLRATVDDRDAVPELVARGVRTAVSDLVDTERFGAVLEDAHTVVHLRGAHVGARRILDGVPDLLAAAEDSGVARIVTLAPVAGEPHPGAAALAGSPYDTVVLRVGVVLAPPPADLPVPAARARLAPLWVGDLVEAIVAADRLRDLHGHHQLDAVGPDVVTGAALARMLGVRPRRFVLHRPDLVGDRGAALARVLHIRQRPLTEAVTLCASGRT